MGFHSNIVVSLTCTAYHISTPKPQNRYKQIVAVLRFFKYATCIIRLNHLKDVLAPLPWRGVGVRSVTFLAHSHLEEGGEVLHSFQASLL